MAKNYESELTQFLNKHKVDYPDTEARQRAGRAILWDHELDSEMLNGFRAARVAMLPYVYYDNPATTESRKAVERYPPTLWFYTSWLA